MWAAHGLDVAPDLVWVDMIGHGAHQMGDDRRGHRLVLVKPDLDEVLDEPFPRGLVMPPG
jgi:hypothetical protein